MKGVISPQALAAAVAKGYAHPKIDPASGKTIYVCTVPFVVMSDNSVEPANVARERHHEFAK